MNLDIKAVQSTFGALVGIDRVTVRSFIEKDVLTPGDTYRGWLLAYCKRLREVASGRYTEGDLDLTEERARLARAQTERIEMELAIKRAEIAPVDTLRDSIAPVMAQVGAIMDSIPVKLKREAPHLTASDLEVIKREIAKAMNLVAAIRYEPNQTN